jgi:excisionase family DNA binding protein
MEGSKRSDSQRRFFGPQEVADQLGTSRGFIYSLMEAGDLRSLKLGGRRIIPASEIERLVEMAEAVEAPRGSLGQRAS